jgi:hypothetical protein
LYSVAGSSDVLDRFVEDFKYFLFESIDREDSVPETIYAGYDTSFSVTLDFEIDSMVNSVILGKLREQSFDDEYSVGTIHMNGIRLAVSYPNLPEKLKNHGIRLVEKEIAIERRVGTGPNLKRYFVSAPIRSGDLLSLIETIEKSI